MYQDTGPKIPQKTFFIKLEIFLIFFLWKSQICLIDNFWWGGKNVSGLLTNLMQCSDYPTLSCVSWISWIVRTADLWTQVRCQTNTIQFKAVKQKVTEINKNEYLWCAEAGLLVEPPLNNINSKTRIRRLFWMACFGFFYLLFLYEPHMLNKSLFKNKQKKRYCSYI